jgi:hypothetical protein
MKIAPLADIKARFSSMLAYPPKSQRILRAAKRQIRDNRGIKHQEFWRELEAKAKRSQPGNIFALTLRATNNAP